MEPLSGLFFDNANNNNNNNSRSTKLSAEELAAAVGNITPAPPSSQRRRSSVSTLSVGSDLPPSARMIANGRSPHGRSGAPPAPPAGTFSKRGSSGCRRRSSTGVPSQIVSSSSGLSMADAAAIVRAMGLDVDDDMSDDEDDSGSTRNSAEDDNEEESLQLAQLMAPPNTNSASAGGTPPRATERKKRASVLSKELVIDEDSEEDNDNRNADNERRRQRKHKYEAKQERVETARRASVQASGDFIYDGSSGSLGRAFSDNELERLQEESLSSQSQTSQEAWNARKDKVYRRTNNGSIGGLMSYGELSLDSFKSADTGSTISVGARRRPPAGITAPESDRDEQQEKHHQQQAKPRPYRRTSHGSLGVMSFGELSLNSEESSLSDAPSTSRKLEVGAQSSHDVAATAPTSTEDNSFEKSTTSSPQDYARTINDDRQDKPIISGANNSDTGAKNSEQPLKPRPFRRTSHGSLGVMSFGSLSMNSDISPTDSTTGISNDSTCNRGTTSRKASTAEESTSSITAELTYDDIERRSESTMPLKDHSRQQGCSRPRPHKQVYRRPSQGSLGKQLSYGELSLLSTCTGADSSSARSRDP